MASWLPETLFEIVGQGPAPSKDYYQLLVTRSQVLLGAVPSLKDTIGYNKVQKFMYSALMELDAEQINLQAS